MHKCLQVHFALTLIYMKRSFRRYYGGFCSTVCERCIKGLSSFRSDQGGLSFWMSVYISCFFVCVLLCFSPPLNQITYFGRIILFQITCTKMAKLKITPTQNPLQTFQLLPQ